MLLFLLCPAYFWKQVPPSFLCLDFESIKNYTTTCRFHPLSSAAWRQLEENLLQHVSSLVQDSNFDFWRNGRFLIHVDRQLASSNDGKIWICKSWRTWKMPELIYVSPLAVVDGEEIALFLRGRNLTAPGTKVLAGAGDLLVLTMVRGGTVGARGGWRRSKAGVAGGNGWKMGNSGDCRVGMDEDGDGRRKAELLVQR
ncbi:uncharacterized protein LOC131148427 [Malania oleifera]|uniref:uncharacterized protein LOC131148427 n=1 Tax=Malania oleifera TaxID=397392 RepID=UPI0025ADD7AC|nr:uncharacterized protein LOC131148427 [Malania oleifera]